MTGQLSRLLRRYLVQPPEPVPEDPVPPVRAPWERPEPAAEVADSTPLRICAQRSVPNEAEHGSGR